MTGSLVARRILMALALPVVLVVAWFLISAGSTSPFWPPLSRILQSFVDTWITGDMSGDIGISLGRLLAGYAIALVAGVAVGVAIGSLPILRAATEPALEFFRAIPPTVLVPVIVLFAGIGDGMKIAVIAFGCFWPVLLNCVQGVRAVDEVLKDTALCYRVRPVSRLFTLTLPAASPQIVAGARQALSIGIILMVVSEMFAASNGIGFAVVQFQRNFALPQMWSGIILLGLIGVILSVIFRLIEGRVLSWYQRIRAVERASR
jgi:ABC-type nitrate/sulfonate/bicarbonate transport system permease component